MSPIVERLAELRQHLDHLRVIRPRITSADALRRDLSLRNDVLPSLQTVCQVVIDSDVAREVCASMMPLLTKAIDPIVVVPTPPLSRKVPLLLNSVWCRRC
jgi:hypothetical protein